jgi:hypothetical protein
MAACPDCGGELPDGASLCPGCGAPRAKIVLSTSPYVNRPFLPSTPGVKKTDRRLPTGAVIAIIAGCVTVVIIVILVVLLSISFVDIFKKPVDVTNAYIKALSTGNVETAWDYLSVRTRAEKGRADFESDVHGLEGRIETWNASGVQIRDRRAQVALDIGFKDGGETTLYVYLVKESGEWCVSSTAEAPFPGFEEH